MPPPPPATLLEASWFEDQNGSMEEYLRFLNSSDHYDLWRSDWTALAEDGWNTAVITLYSIVIIFGFFANMLVVVVICRYKQLHTVTNIFICYLAMADVALCVFNLPLQLHYQLSSNWMFGKVLCYVAMPTFGVPLFSSSMAILMIAIDRYCKSSFPPFLFFISSSLSSFLGFFLMVRLLLPVLPFLPLFLLLLLFLFFEP